jgi:2-oxoisovalerate dehydrogenase E2 component (dihydrolipoyl transacylase)
MTETAQFRLPDVGEGLTEAEIVNWRVAVGDTVAVNDPLVEIETAKSLVELPSPFAGTVRELLVAPGRTVPVGTPIVSIETTADERSPQGRAGGVPASASDPARVSDSMSGERFSGVRLSGDRLSGDRPSGGRLAQERPPAVLVGYGPSVSSAQRRRRRPGSAVPAARGPVDRSVAHGSSTVIPPAAAASAARVTLAKPPVRKLAKDLGVDLTSISGTGAGGVITREDVLHHDVPAEPVFPEAPSAAPAADLDSRIPVRGVRRAVAQAMTASAFTAPHVTMFLTVDVTRSVKLVRKLKEHPAFAGSRVTMLLLAARALVVAASEFPDLNASFDGPAGEIVMHSRVNLGIATASPRGLLVPNVKDAAALTLPALASAVTELTRTARAGQADARQLTGGTITLTNVGVFGVDAGTPILNPGESAILCLGAVRRVPAEHKGRIALRWSTQLAMSIDHRLIDGELGGQALSRIAHLLHHPRQELLLT